MLLYPNVYILHAALEFVRDYVNVANTKLYISHILIVEV